MFKVRFEGGEDLARRLGELGEALSRTIMREALKAGAEPARARAGQLAPRGPGRHGVHLADSMTISTQRSLHDQETAVSVGPSKKAFHGLFVELGTIRQSPKPFLRPAFDQTAPEVLGRTRDAAWRAIKDRLRKSGAPGSTGGGRLL